MPRHQAVKLVSGLPVDIVCLDTTPSNPIYRDPLFTFNKHFMLFSKHISMSLITTSYESILQNCLSNTFTKMLQSHNSAFFTIAAPNESHPSMYTLHLKCFPIKGEPRLVERLLKRLLPPLNAHVMFTWTHSHVYQHSNRMMHLLWNTTCHAMK